MLGLMDKVKGFLFSPSATFNKVKREEWSVSYKFYVKLLLLFAVLLAITMAVIGWFIITIILGFIISMMTGLGIPAGILTSIFPSTGMVLGIMAAQIFIFTVICGLIVILIASGWVHIWVYLCGGRKGIGQTFKAVAYGSTPSLIFGWILPVGVIFGIWSMVVSIIGIKQLHEISMGRAALAYLIGTIVPAIVVWIIIPVLI